MYSFKKTNRIFLISLFLITSETLNARVNQIHNINFNTKNYILDNTAKRKNIPTLLSNIKWEKYKNEFYNQKTKPSWEKINEDELKIIENNLKYSKKPRNIILSSLNRSIVFNERVGPDVSWLVPSGLAWSENHKFDFSTRGHSRRKSNEKFLAWNGGDAVGLISYQAIHTNKYSFGLNLGIRSVYSGSHGGGTSPIGEGLSMGFRLDRRLSDTAGWAFGGEQLAHFDNLTDTGRDIYLTATKGWWENKEIALFPLTTATIGVGTGKMAEGNVKGLCSNLFDGSGTEVFHQRPLCWSPVFSLSRVYNESFSTFFEYNSKWFLLGTSVAPMKSIPLRGTFAVQISDHVDNYKINNTDELKWNFRLSLGF
tara:strand:+ start:5388 stop:6491 length:1104 start_codon:yes stop_codon:yes gene_type:complete